MKTNSYRHNGPLSKLTLAAAALSAALASGCGSAMESENEEQALAESHQALRELSKPGVATGLDYAMALRPDGTVWAWGQNDAGQLGDGTTTDRLSPVQVSGLPEAGTSVESVWAGAYYSLALLSDGTVRAWGSNSDGQLGDGTIDQRNAPVKVLKNPATGEALSGVVALAAGYSHTLALDDSGYLWAWGDNYNGELGDGTKSGRKTPVQVLKNPATGEVLSSVVAIAAGRDHSLAVLSDGTVWSWGSNAKGQLGNGTKVSSSTPVQVQGISDAVDVGAGRSYSHAVLSDGSLLAWGYNYNGQLGEGTKSDRLTPVPVLNLSGATFVEGSEDNFTVALKPDGSLWAWGRNDVGQLGNGESICPQYGSAFRLSPVQVTIDQVDSVTASNAFAIARRTDGTIWFWGNNNNGTAGNGGTSWCTKTPVQVPFPSP